MKSEMQELIEAAEAVLDNGAMPTRLYDQLCAAIAAARASEGGWIEIKPGCKLPDVLEEVLVLTSEDEVRKAHRELEERADDDLRECESLWYSRYADQEIYRVTHFQPIPSPPLSVETQNSSK
jgi:Protein of unknown function (DUF551)